MLHLEWAMSYLRYLFPEGIARLLMSRVFIKLGMLSGRCKYLSRPVLKLYSHPKRTPETLLGAQMMIKLLMDFFYSI